MAPHQRKASQAVCCSLLTRPNALVFVDPTDESAVILAARQAQSRSAAGRFSRRSADDLVGRDLAAVANALPRLELEISETGRAHLKRAATGREGWLLRSASRNRNGTLDTQSGTKRVRIDLDESPLDWLRRRKGPDGQRLIGLAEYAAGERLRSDLMQAGLLPSVTARWDAMPTGPAAGRRPMPPTGWSRPGNGCERVRRDRRGFRRSAAGSVRLPQGSRIHGARTALAAPFGKGGRPAGPGASGRTLRHRDLRQGTRRLAGIRAGRRS